MKNKKTTAPSTKHPKSKSLQNLHGINPAQAAAAAAMDMAAGACPPGADNHPGSAPVKSS